MIWQFQGPYRFLSNFAPATVELDGVVYPSVEHAYQAAKTADPATRATIARMTPGEAKRYARTIVIRPDWNAVRLQVMTDLVRQKFARHATLRNRLLATYPEELQEGNHWGDRFWGVDLHSGRGENHLGRILMQIREELVRNGGSL